MAVLSVLLNHFHRIDVPNVYRDPALRADIGNRALSAQIRIHSREVHSLRCAELASPRWIHGMKHQQATPKVRAEWPL